MAAVAGYLGTLKLGASGGANTVANVKDWEIPLAADMYDVSALGNQWKAYIPGLTGASAKATVFWDTTDTNGQVAIQNAFLAGTQLTANFWLNGTHYYSSACYIKQIDIKVAVNAAEEASLDLQLTGPISYT